MSLEIAAISKKYGNQKALDEVSFRIETGEIVGFLGPNGAGKSTLMKIITGYLAQDSGEIFLNEQNIKKSPIEMKRRIGYLPEHNPLYWDMYVREYLNFSGKIYGFSGKELARRTEKMLALTGLLPECHKKTGALSKGYRQRVGLAAALIHDPDVLILDEPTTGLDPNQILEIRQLIQETGMKKTVMLSTHIMQEVEALCNKFVIINKGKVVLSGAVQTEKKQTENTPPVFVEFNRKPPIEKLQTLQNIAEVQALSGTRYLIQTLSEKDLRPALFQFAVDNELILLSMYRKKSSMEDVFRNITTKEQA
ncbi:MAG: gliding motility-associated ABC transporter ATP-binding subunit GldA [Bacteroidia bacterium]|nr:MAG: gliding motility-associated ABC transporter ATP-binding subunit GldA [Bacteroidia bacterium]